MYSINLHHLLLLQSGDTKIKQGILESSTLKVCHWNLNGIATHDFLKVTLIEVIYESK